MAKEFQEGLTPNRSPLGIARRSQCLKFAGLCWGRGTNLQFKGAIDTVPARLSAAPVSGCGARCERSVLAVGIGGSVTRMSRADFASSNQGLGAEGFQPSKSHDSPFNVGCDGSQPF